MLWLADQGDAGEPPPVSSNPQRWAQAPHVLSPTICSSSRCGGVINGGRGALV